MTSNIALTLEYTIKQTFTKEQVAIQFLFLACVNQRIFKKSDGPWFIIADQVENLLTEDTRFMERVTNLIETWDISRMAYVLRLAQCTHLGDVPATDLPFDGVDCFSSKPEDWVEYLSTGLLWHSLDKAQMSELHDTYVKGFAEEGEQLASLIKEHIEARDAENAQYDDILPQRVQEEVFDRSVKVLQSAGYRVVKPDGTVLDKK
jgi:hypothetical protein